MKRTCTNANIISFDRRMDVSIVAVGDQYDAHFVYTAPGEVRRYSVVHAASGTLRRMAIAVGTEHSMNALAAVDDCISGLISENEIR